MPLAGTEGGRGRWEFCARASGFLSSPLDSGVTVSGAKFVGEIAPEISSKCKVRRAGQQHRSEVCPRVSQRGNEHKSTASVGQTLENTTIKTIAVGLSSNLANN